MEETKTTDIIQETDGGMEEPKSLPSTDLSLGQCAKYGLAAAATIAVSVVLYKKLFRISNSCILIVEMVKWYQRRMLCYIVLLIL